MRSIAVLAVVLSLTSCCDDDGIPPVIVDSSPRQPSDPEVISGDSINRIIQNVNVNLISLSDWYDPDRPVFWSLLNASTREQIGPATAEDYLRVMQVAYLKPHKISARKLDSGQYCIDYDENHPD